MAHDIRTIVLSLMHYWLFIMWSLTKRELGLSSHEFLKQPIVLSLISSRLLRTWEYLRSFCVLVSSLPGRASFHALMVIPRMRSATANPEAYVGLSAWDCFRQSLCLKFLSLSPLQMQKHLKTFLLAGLASTDT